MITSKTAMLSYFRILFLRDAAFFKKDRPKSKFLFIMNFEMILSICSYESFSKDTDCFSSLLFLNGRLIAALGPIYCQRYLPKNIFCMNFLQKEIFFVQKLYWKILYHKI